MQIKHLRYVHDSNSKTGDEVREHIRSDVVLGQPKEYGHKVEDRLAMAGERALDWMPDLVPGGALL